MKGIPEDRARRLARYIVKNKATVRAAAMAFGIGKSTVHKDVALRLRQVDPGLWARVRQVLDQNREERHLRGGEATREKYKRVGERGVSC